MVLSLFDCPRINPAGTARSIARAILARTRHRLTMKCVIKPFVISEKKTSATLIGEGQIGLLTIIEMSCQRMIIMIIARMISRRFIVVPFGFSSLGRENDMLSNFGNLLNQNQDCQSR